MQRDRYHHGDLRNALVTAAGRLIETNGPVAFSLRKAARDVGVSANAAYRHFDDKSVLITAVAARGFSQLAERMRHAMENATATLNDEPASVARFMAVGRAYVEFAIDHPQIFRVMFGEFGASCLHSGNSVHDAPWAILSQSLDALVAERVLARERRHGAEMKAWSVVHGVASLWVDGLAMAPTQRERQSSLEALLWFTVVGICSDHQLATRAARP